MNHLCKQRNEPLMSERGTDRKWIITRTNIEKSLKLNTKRINDGTGAN